ncbi:AAA ATPase midasin [Entomortierella chlamydospora]|uniref:AAA ATPase midasin n=1 Tax=Entomortierella chlamydospora TaxID=101097 RepID=A0A9P6T3V6_9FUNG|nr:AAA ATPase midasin [Entomortierella chlamydospora]
MRSSNGIASQLIRRIVPDGGPIEPQCEDVLYHSDRCAYVEEHCSDYAAGRINYLHFYFCDLGSLPALALIIMTGVTFLAFGNASPDIFSTFSAIGAGSGTLAIGEVVGAAAFTTSVVVGSMMVAQPFKISREPFLRDTIFFTGCILFTLYMVMSKEIKLWQSVTLIVAYVVYVAFVVYGGWQHQIGAESDNTSQGQEHKQDAHYSSNDVDCTEDTVEAPLLKSDQPEVKVTPTDESPSSSSGSGFDGFQPETLHNSGSILNQNRKPKLSRPQCPVIIINDYSHLSSSSKKMTQKKDNIGYTTLSRDVGSNEETNLGLSPLSPLEGDVSPSHSRFHHVLRRNSLILPDRSNPNNRPRSPIFQDPSTRHFFQDSIPRVSFKQRSISVFNDWIKPAFFPTLLGWDEKSWFLRILAVGSIPIVLFLTLSLPVVDLADEEPDNEGTFCAQNVQDSCGSLEETDSSSQSGHVDLYDGWCQLSTMVKMVIAPVFMATVIGSAAGSGQEIILIALGVGITMSGVIYMSSTEEKPPRFYEALAFVGFLVGMTWIFLVANEVVGILQTFGMVLGIGDAILGLTVFAMGNSLGDLVANITVAKMGYPRMAFSACFGGPLLNMLLGVGISGTYVSLRAGSHVPVEISPTLVVSLGGVLVTMLGAMVVVPLNGILGGTELEPPMTSKDQFDPSSPRDEDKINRIRQTSSSSITSFASESSISDQTEWFKKDTSVQYLMTPAEQDPAVGFFYTPRTLTILSLMLLGLVYVAMTPDIDDTGANVKLGLVAAIGAFCVFGMLQFRDSLLRRPHPALWRVVLSIGVVYQLFLVFLLFQNKHDARLFFKYLDPSLGMPLPEKSYGDACELTYDNVVSQVFDEFVLAHAIGWFCKALILRDYTFCWILSVMFEVMEYSLSHQLNNFDECWWDHFLVCELNAFYLKTLLWIPPAHWINVCRIFSYFMFGIPGVREAYQFFYDKDCKRIGPQAWLLIGSISTEVLIIFKFGYDEFPNPAPKPVIYFWVFSMASSIHDPLSMDLSSATTDLLEFLDTQTHVSLSEGILSSAQRQALTAFAADGSSGSLTRGETSMALNIISHLLKNQHFSIKIVELYRPLVLDLVARWLAADSISTPSTSSSSSPLIGSNLPDMNHNKSSKQDLESMARAFALILPIIPQIKSFAVRLFSQYPSPLEWLNTLTEKDYRSPSEDITARAQDTLMTCFRLLNFSQSTFATLWDWTPIYNLLSYNDDALKYLAIRCLAIVLDIRDDQIATAMKAHLTPGTDISWITGSQKYRADLLTLMEQDRISAAQLALFNNPTIPKPEEAESATYRRITVEDLSPLTVNLCGVLLARSNNAHPKQSSLSEHKLVLTETTKHNLHSIGLALSIGAPVLLEGVTGAGKTALVEEVARVTGHLVKIHLGDQTDSKVLLGTYVSTSKPGSFKWQAGVLTTAVRDGKWLLIEDIDLAPMEVLSVLLPLLESRTLFIPSRGEKIPAHEGFQLFATKSMIPTRSGRMMARNVSGTDGSIGANLWTRVQVNSLTHQELSQIIHERFQDLGDRILPNLIMSVFESISATFASPEFSSSQSMVSRVISPRDLMKWCTRIDTLIKAKGGYMALGNLISSTRGVDQAILQDLFSEAVDCFCSMIAEYEVWERVLIRLGAALTIPEQLVRHYINAYTPELDDRNPDMITIGRVTLPILSTEQGGSRKKSKKSDFAKTAHAAKLMERIAVSVHLNEPVLLVGETGTGKTTVVQHLASLLNHNLTVINLSQQSDSSDLLGGFKPVDVKVLAVPLKNMFDDLFSRTFSRKKNQQFINLVDKLYVQNKWDALIKAWSQSVQMAESKLDTSKQSAEGEITASKKTSPTLRKDWQAFADQLSTLKETYSASSAKFVFSFLEGALVKAVRRGDWILLDEINLATTETLECLSGLLQDEHGSILLAERGDSEPVVRHKNFRVFACMNPATDVGKKDLPPGLRNRFTEFYVHPPDARREDLLEIIKKYLESSTLGDQRAIADIADFYLAVKALSNAHKLADGANQRPHFSMRTLTRALQFVREIITTYGLRRSIYEAFSMTFLTQLSKDSERIVQALVEKHLLNGVKNPRQCGSHPIQDDGQYILTASVEHNLNNLSRVVMTRRFPILIQGPTSAGKTSMIEYLAHRLGHKFVRINNHEHTDLQEYIGTDVLEALNRLLDDNRELVIPETGEIVKPHPDFMLFATQNPAGLYGGRKQLSRAFRNRFLELFFDEIPESELETILSRRCTMAPSYCKRLVEVYKKLMTRRQTTRLFEQGHGFITLRDLFRWAGRGAGSYDELAMDGYMILAERCRKDEERVVVKEVLEEVMRSTIDLDQMYNCPEVLDYMQRFHGGQENVVWTKAMKRLFTLVSRCLKNSEPVLLVGETGCGKTTVCQMLSEHLGRSLVIVNCHQNTETADLLGGQRPVRNNQGFVASTKVELTNFIIKLGGEITFVAEEADLDAIVTAFESFVKAGQFESKTLDDGTELGPVIAELRRAYRQATTLFEWHDGPLVQSMKEGHLFLLDEISLADDSVLERLNSVLEPQRLLVLAEKGGKTVEVMNGVPNFQFLATMNPGGDYGKKELSPALRNRFTEIWVPAVTDRDDLVKIIEEQIKYKNEMAGFAERILDFVAWFTHELGKSRVVVSLRDILAWVRFMNALMDKGQLTPEEAFVHGGSLVLLDGLGSNASAGGASLTGNLLKEFRLRSLATLSKNEEILRLGEAAVFAEGFGTVRNEGDEFGITPFFIQKGDLEDQKIKFALLAPTTTDNAMRVLRAMQLKKPILLEGSPGVGKTSLISALATASAHNLVRINLSEQTDLMDLFGSDLPVEGGNSGEFAWRDAPFLQAMKNGDWVLLDEINLASQSVLEGLNSCLDHRGSVYIPELDRSFACDMNFRVFAAQNPLQQGGGRKGLPKSFVNRFTQVFVEQLTDGDILFICKHLFPQVEDSILRKMIEFNYQMFEETMVKLNFGRKGSPWEFNLRDVFRWMELMTLPNHGLGYNHDPSEHFDLIYLQRMRTEEDRAATTALFEKIFGQPYNRSKAPYYHLDDKHFQVGHSLLPRRHGDTTNVLGKDLHLLQSFLSPLESLMKCVEVNWMAILTGPASSGKTSIVRLLANLTGNKLEEFSMNSGVDTMELLGGFEQVDVARHQEHIMFGLSRLASRISREMLLVENHGQISNVSYAREISQNLYLLHSQDKFAKRNSLERNLADERIMRNNAIESLLNQLRYLIQEFKLNFVKEIEELDEKFKILRGLEVTSVSGRFEWIDGSLINALEHGYWLLIDNANLSNPSVLDRLNSLMEPNGTLMVNERGLVDGEVRIIRPHPNFRIFMTVDPRYGELSRAMRNRGVEITLVDAEWINNVQDSFKITNSLGVRGSGVPTMISQIHHYIHDYFKLAMPWKTVHAKEMLLYTRFVVERLQRGEPLEVALRHSVQQVYTFEGENRLELPTTDALQAPSFVLEPKYENALSVTNCPHLLEGRMFSQESKLATVSLHGSYLMYLLLLDAPTTMTWTAARYFLETSSIYDSDLRKTWIRTLLETRDLEESNRAQALMADHILDLLTQSSLMPRLASLKESLATKLSLDKSFLESQPADMRLNPNLFWAIDRLCQQNEEAQAVWLEYQSVARLIGLFIRVKKMEYIEERVYAQARGKKPNTVQISYLHQRQLWDKPLQHQVVAEISPCLTAIRSIVTQWIMGVNGLSEENATKLHLFLDKRDMVWEAVQEPTVNVGELMILVKMVAESGEFLLTISQEFFGPLFHSLNIMTEAMVLTTGTLMKTLWRRLHPSVLASQELVDVEEELLKIALTVDVWSEECILDKDVLAKARAIGSMPEFKDTLIDAIATLYFVDQSPENGAILLKTIKHVPAHLQKQIEGVQKQLEGYPKIKSASHQEAENFMYPIMDFSSSVAEMALLSKLQQSLPQGVKLSKKVLDEVKALHEFSLKRTTRSPVDFVPHKRLIWVFDSDTKDVSENTQAVYNRLVQDVLHNWHARLWSNAYKDAKFDSFGGKVPKEDVREITAIQGPAKIFQSVDTVAYFNYLTTLPKAAISSMDIQLEQIRSLVAHQARASKHINRVAASLINLISSIDLLLEAVAQVHIEISISQYREALNALTVTLSSNTRQSQAFEASLSTLSHFKPADIPIKPSSVGRHLALSISQLLQCIQMYLDVTGGEVSLQSYHGKAWVNVGLAFTALYIPDYSLDPTAKPRLMLHALRLKQEALQSEIKVRQEIESTFTGSKENANILEKLEELRRVEYEIEHFALDVALRPAKSQLEELFKQVWQIQKAAVNVETITGLVEKIEAVKDGSQFDQEKLFQDITHEFIRRNGQKFRAYRDILQPLIVAIYQVKFGVRLIASAGVLSNVQDREALESIVTCLVRVPDYHTENSEKFDSLHVVTQPATLQVVKRTVFDKNVVSKPWSFYLKYLITALQCQRREIAASGILDMPSIDTLDNIFAEVTDIWTKGEEHAAKMAIEQESLYKQRVNKYEGLDDDAIDEATFKEMFPDFADDFKAPDESMTIPDDEPKEPKGVPAVEEKTFDEKDVILIGKLHKTVFGAANLEKCSSATMTPQERRARIWAWYNRASELADVSECSFGHQLDAASQGAHLLSSALMEDWLVGKDNNYWSSEPTYDFYKDQRVAEVVRIVPILQKLRNRLEGILSVWSEHAILESLIEFCNKLLAFPMDSPVAKILAGLEVLLLKTEDWQMNASREYSVLDNQEELKALIISWRQLELTCWPKLLEIQDKNQAESVFSWWFHFYGSIVKPTRDMDLAIDEGIEVDIPAHVKGLLGVLDQFLQASSVGDFLPRMDLLRSFHSHLQIRGELTFAERQRRHKQGDVDSVKEAVASKVADAIWNVHQYYAQFIDNTQSYISTSKKPIEKEMKEHVKIASWKDTNIHALKASALKTHRRLNKLLRKYRDVLRKPLTDIITAYQIETPVVQANKKGQVFEITQPDANIWITESAMLTIPEISRKLFEQSITPSTSETLLNLEVTFNRLKKITSKNIIIPSSDNEPLEELCGDIIQQIEDFQKETPSKMTEENRSQLKNMKTIRKRALVDLLRLLQRLGLNRHRMVRLEEDLLGYVFHLPPTEIQDIEAQAKLDDRVIPASKQVAQLWKKSDDYFYKIVARMMQLRSLSQQPPKDITVVEAEKSRGYTEHLVNLVIEQRQELQTMKTSMDTIRGITSQIQAVFTLPKDRTISLNASGPQILLQQKNALDKLYDLFADSMLVFEATVRHSTSSVRGQMFTIVNEALTKTKSLKHSLDKIVDQWYLNPIVNGGVSPILANSTLDTLSQSLNAVHEIEQSLSSVLENMPEAHSVIAPLMCQISESFPRQWSLPPSIEAEELSLQSNESVRQLVQEVNDEINGCVTFVLLRVQEISKKAKAGSALAASNVSNGGVEGAEEKEEEKDEYGMPEKFITSENKKFAAMHRSLNMDSITKKVRSINGKIQNLIQHQAQHPTTPQQSAAAEALITMRLQELYPFIQQYLFLAQHHLFHFVQYHKTINKLTYVLCNTFSVLFSKGFCIPEMEQEMKEGEEESGVAGTGIGEGDGGKDVSDEIEDEEQVLGTQNEKKQDEDDKKQTEEEDKGIEMENDFEGNLEDVEPASDQEDDDDDDDDEEKEDPDEAIGDVDDDNPEAIDEKMWGDDEAEDARDNDKMIDEDKSTEQNEQESDMVAKDEEDSGKQDDKKKNKKEEKKDNGKDDKDAEAQEGGDQENNDQEAEEDDEAEEEEFEDHNDEESAEHKPDEQQQVEIPEAETLDLPDDLNLDGDEKEGDDGEDDGPEEEPFKDQMDIEEQPSKDKKEGGGDDEEDEDNQEAQESASGEKADDEEMEGPEDENEDEEMAEPAVNGDENGEEKEEEEEDDEESRDDSRQRPNEQARPKMEEKKQEEEEEGENEDDIKASEQEEQPDQDAEAMQEFGVEGEQGKANSSENPKAEADSQRSMESAPTSSKSDPNMEDQQDQQNRPQERGDDSQKESRPSDEKDKEKPKKRETNPHRSLAEALKNWKQKLQDVEDPEEKEEEKEQPAEEVKDEEAKEGEEMEVDENQAFEYLQNDDEAHDMETMGNANEQQMQDRNKDLAAIDEEQMKEDEKEDQVADMDVDPQDEDVDMDQGPEDQKPQLDEEAMEQAKSENAAGAYFSQRMNKRKDDKDEEQDEEAEKKKREAENATAAHEPLKPEEIEELRQQLEVSLGNWRSNGRDPKDAQALWQKYDNLTQDLALGLCEQLRLILEPTQATKLKGDYRTGKRLNMKKIIPYIASQFKKDKIWLRRTKPSKRQYQVMIAIDDSTSMSESHSVQLAYESLALISKALSQLEVGEIGIMSFGERVDLLHPFDQPFTGEAGAKVLQRFGFDQSKTKVKEMMESSIALLQHTKMNQSGAARSQELWQLQIIISDGICESHETLKALVRQAAEHQIMLIFIILDNKPEKESIMKMTTASFTTVNGMPKLSLNPYLETFPFDYYVVLQNINSLPETLADALRQYFSFVAA